MKPICHPIDKCRACGNAELVPILDLGEQALTGVFPRPPEGDPPSGPLKLVKCHGGANVCHLVQLAHQYDGSMMYGSNYGYRSGLNRSMVEHLRRKATGLMELVKVGRGDIVVDIGSNDGTSLSFYPKEATLIGIDPTSAKFAKYYPAHVRPIADFFSEASFRKATGSDSARAKIVTSISMFYDLDDPMQFMRDVFAILADDGIWHLEQSYMPGMLDTNSYDTVCHEHVEYYSLSQIAWMAEHVGFRLVDVVQNEVNGASFALTVAKATPSNRSHEPVVQKLLAEERAKGFETLAPYVAFAERTRRHRDDLRAFLAKLRSDGRKVFGLGASTKGNVVLQYCGLGPSDLECIAEVNEDKFGCVTPGSRIPIISEAEAHARRPDVLMTLPWHFRPHFMKSEKAFMDQGGRLLFPLPHIELVP